MWLPDGRVRKFRRSSEDPGCAHELTFSCNGKLPLLDNDENRELVVAAIERSRARNNIELWAYVIMPDHMHLLLLPRDLQYYIHNNPVRRGLVESATDWAWSSARQYAGFDDVKLEMDSCPPDPPR